MDKSQSSPEPPQAWLCPQPNSSSPKALTSTSPAAAKTNSTTQSAKSASVSPVYAATKAALRSFARTWAAELAERGIRVNVLSPGPTDTAMIAGIPPELREQIAALIPLKRLGQPADIAKVALFLASDDSSFVTGIDLPVDGGLAQI